jgi:hypothetical protein
MSGATLPFPLYAFMTFMGTALALPCCLMMQVTPFDLRDEKEDF